MQFKKATNLFFIAIASLWATSLFAQKIDTSSNRVKTDLNINLKRIGTIIPKNTSEITASNWILGCETGHAQYPCNHRWCAEA